MSYIKSPISDADQIRARARQRLYNTQTLIDQFGTPNPSPAAILNWKMAWKDEHYNAITFSDLIKPASHVTTGMKRTRLNQALRELDVNPLFVHVDFVEDKVVFYHAEDLVMFKLTCA